MRTALAGLVLLLLAGCSTEIPVPPPAPKPLPLPNALINACSVVPTKVPIPPPPPRTVKALGEYAKQAEHAGLANAALLNDCHAQLAEYLASP